MNFYLLPYSITCFSDVIQKIRVCSAKKVHTSLNEKCETSDNERDKDISYSEPRTLSSDAQTSQSVLESLPTPRTLYTTIESILNPVPVPQSRIVKHVQPFITATNQKKNFDDYAFGKDSSSKLPGEPTLSSRHSPTAHHVKGAHSNEYSGYLGCIAPEQRKVYSHITTFVRLLET